MQEIPLLVVDSAACDPAGGERVTAEVRVGGHPCRVVLDFSRRALSFVEYLEVPPLLERDRPAMRAVVELLDRVARGERLDFPLDLSEKVRAAERRSIFAPPPAVEQERLDRLADAVTLEVIGWQDDTPEPGQTTAALRVSGRAVNLVAEVHAGPERVPYTRWIREPEVDLTEGERYAIHRLLVRRCGEGPESQ